MAKRNAARPSASKLAKDGLRSKNASLTRKAPVKKTRRDHIDGDPTAPASASLSDRTIAARLTAWFEQNARTFPWRAKPGGERCAYESLVLEAMAQQTQISRVVERLPLFLAKFPSVLHLSRAKEEDVLAAWSGMGYYRRARLLHGAAKKVVSDFAGVLPRNVDDLRSLPGVGRYTAGAISSMAYGERSPIVDGNVARVLLRVHGRAVSADDRTMQPWLWERAAALVHASERPGVFNEALMELGATVCAPPPATPRCEVCPLSDGCEARKSGLQMEIPIPKRAATRRVLWCGVVVIRDDRGNTVLEQRSEKGMWAGMWQAPTIERENLEIDAEVATQSVGLDPSLLVLRCEFVHQTTHREVRFRVWDVLATARAKFKRGSWRSIDDVRDGVIAVSNAQKRILLQEPHSTPASKANRQLSRSPR